MASIHIPQHVGTILLKNAVTFPHGMMPLHIFEPRYRKMLTDALEAESMICVANLQSDETSDPAQCTSNIGYLGLIRYSEKQEDERSHLILHSISRVDFLSWQTDTKYPYPRAQIRPIKDILEPDTASTEIIIASLRDATSRFLKQFDTEVIARTNEVLDRVNEDLSVLSDVVAQHFITNAALRQQLLEDNQPSNRAEKLIRYLRAQKH